MVYDDGELVVIFEWGDVAMSRSLRSLLSAVQAKAGECFTGVGVVVTATPDVLPITPLRNFAPDLSGDVVADLAALSVTDSPFHDGFHILSPEFRILRVAQYFSPPIVPWSLIDRSRLVGGRYAAALYGSALAGVRCTGIASGALGVSIFEDGVDVKDGTLC
nr:hypothetical protein [Brevundimonas diminuta]